MDAAFVEAVLSQPRDRARAAGGIEVPAWFPDGDVERFLRLRLAQMQRDPGVSEWLARAMVLREPDRPMVGHVGFHGPPGVNGPRRVGALEIGYTVFEPYRRRGFATEAVQALLSWASERGVTHFVACVAPDNGPSLALVRRLGFVQTGTQWDDDDDREELVFELVR